MTASRLRMASVVAARWNGRHDWLRNSAGGSWTSDRLDRELPRWVPPKVFPDGRGGEGCGLKNPGPDSLFPTHSAHSGGGSVFYKEERWPTTSISWPSGLGWVAGKASFPQLGLVETSRQEPTPRCNYYWYFYNSSWSAVIGCRGTPGAARVRDAIQMHVVPTW